jgi:streptogramin lyase
MVVAPAAAHAARLETCAKAPTHADGSFDSYWPVGLTWGRDGKVWFVGGGMELNARSYIGRVDGDCTGYKLFNGPVDAHLFDVTTGSDGNLWATSWNWGNGTWPPGPSTNPPNEEEGPAGVEAIGQARGYVARINPRDPSDVAKFPLYRNPSPSEGRAWPVDITPYEIEAGPDGRIWFTAQDYVAKSAYLRTSNRQSYVGAFHPSDPMGTFKSWLVSGMITAIHGDGPDGKVWFITANRTADHDGAGIGAIDPKTETREFWPFPGTNDLNRLDAPVETGGPTFGSAYFGPAGLVTGAGLTSTYLTEGPDGNVWFTEELANHVGRFSPANGSFAYFTQNFPERHTLAGITDAADGHLYALNYFDTADVYKIDPRRGIVGMIPDNKTDPRQDGGLNWLKDPRNEDVLWFTAKGRIGRLFLDGAGRRAACLSRRSPIGPRNVGRVRLGLSRRRLLALPVRSPRRTRRSLRWCVKRSRGKVTAVLSPHGRARLVVTTAAVHGNRRVRPGARVSRLSAYPSRVALGGGLYRATPGSPRLIGTRGGRVRFIAVADRGLLRNPRALRRYLRLASR